MYLFAIKRYIKHLNIQTYGDSLKEEEFIAKVRKARRITIPKPVTEILDVKEGDTVRVKVSKVS
jgi:AbrB family looped-hinge helix DNA binding protein